MSGVVGVFHLDGRPADHARVSAMLRTIRHRGLHGLSVEVDGPVGLGEVAIHAARTRRGHGPSHPDLAIVADCRLDNRDDLIVQLAQTAERVDAELILAAYARWGEACVERLQGDFAFAVWDRRRDRLFCARDHFGVRPFCYHFDGRRFLFGSEVKAVLAGGLPRGATNPLRIAEFLAGLPPSDGGTFHDGVLRLPPASACIVEAGGLKLRRYWTLAPGERRPRETAPEVRDRLRTAVRRRLRGEAPVGVMLSGGLDSSSIACLAGDLLGESPPLPTFSMVFERAPEGDERPYIDAVLARGGFAPTQVACDDHSAFLGLERMLAEQDGPVLAPNLSMQNRVTRTAATSGVRVLLDGHGGDEVIGHGWGRLSQMAASLRLAALHRELSRMEHALPQAPSRMLGAYLRRFGPLARARQLLKRGARSAEVTIPLLAADLPQHRELAERLAAQRVLPLNETAQHVARLGSDLQAYALEVLDRAAASAGIEPRYPFWDKDLVEFCVSVDPAEKLADGWTRLSLRRAMEGVLPPQVQWRRDKFDFTPHLVRAVLRDRDLLDDVIADRGHDLASYLDLSQLAAAHQRLLASPETAQGEDAHGLVRAVTLSVWLRSLRGAAVAAPEPVAEAAA